MLHAQVNGKALPGEATLVLLHFLGGSVREWDEVIADLGPGFRTVAIDLPGFGGSAHIAGYSVQAMADAVSEVIARECPGRFVLVGHSMGGKVAGVVARRMASSAALSGLVLLAPSPPSPEPMTQEKRDGMMGSLGVRRGGDRNHARAFITRNEERDIPAPVVARAVDEVLRMNRAAWRAWLDSGSREDWSERVGVLQLPALVVAGERDASLGPETQRRVTMPHLAHATLRTLPGCSHLIPMERPAELAGMLRDFLQSLPAPHVPAAYMDLLASDRVSPRTREVLEARLDGPAGSNVFTPAQLLTLRLLLARVVPQSSGADIDLAGYIAARLASGKGDGWRYAVLPPDLEAYRHGLDALAAIGFDRMDEAAQHAAIRLLDESKGSPQARWFEDVRADAAAAYMAHPATMARVGFSGIGVGGANTPHHGFVSIGINDAEAWEPNPALETVAG